MNFTEPVHYVFLLIGLSLLSGFVTGLVVSVIDAIGWRWSK